MVDAIEGLCYIPSKGVVCAILFKPVVRPEIVRYQSPLVGKVVEFTDQKGTFILVTSGVCTSSQKEAGNGKSKTSEHSICLVVQWQCLCKQTSTEHVVVLQEYNKCRERNWCSNIGELTILENYVFPTSDSWST